MRTPIKRGDEHVKLGPPRRTFTEKVTGKPIGELALADLMMIDDFLKDRERS